MTLRYQRPKYCAEFKTAKQTEGKQARADAVSALKTRAIAETIPDPDAENAVCPQTSPRSGMIMKKTSSET